MENKYVARNKKVLYFTYRVSFCTVAPFLHNFTLQALEHMLHKYCQKAFGKLLVPPCKGSHTIYHSHLSIFHLHLKEQRRLG